MADFAISPVVVLAVSRQNPMHDPADRVRTALDKQVNMICHHAVGVKKERQTLLLSRKERKKLLMVGIRMKDRPAIIAANYDVIKAALQFDPQSSCHVGKILLPYLTLVNRESQYRRPDPKSYGPSTLFSAGFSSNAYFSISESPIS